MSFTVTMKGLREGRLGEWRVEKVAGLPVVDLILNLSHGRHFCFVIRFLASYSSKTISMGHLR